MKLKTLPPKKENQAINPSTHPETDHGGVSITSGTVVYEGNAWPRHQAHRLPSPDRAAQHCPTVCPSCITRCARYKTILLVSANLFSCRFLILCGSKAWYSCRRSASFFDSIVSYLLAAVPCIDRIARPCGTDWGRTRTSLALHFETLRCCSLLRWL